jgi:hypothetical protein
MSDSNKNKNATRANRGSIGPGNVSTGTRDLPSRADLEAQLQSSTGPVTCVKDARVWLDTKGWILAGEKYTKPKLADILFTVALSSKLPNDASSAIKAVAFLIEEIADQDFSTSLANMITDKISSQISSSIDDLATGIASTKEFLNAVTRQQAESTLALQESVLSNSESSKSIANTAEKLSDTATKQPINNEWPTLPSAPLAAGNAFHPASLVHTSLSSSHVKIQQRTLLAARQLLIELGPLDENASTIEKSTQNQTTHRDLFNSWIDEDDKTNNNFTAPSKAVRGVTIFDRPAMLIEFDSPGSKSRFTKLCEDAPDLLASLSPNAQIRLRTYPVIFKFVPCNGAFDPSNLQHLRELEQENDLKPNSIISASWCKRPEKRSPGQSTANLKVQCLNAEAANCVLKERIRVAGNLVNVHKDLRQPMRCVKCHNYGHFKDSCPNEERCANCASDSHSTADCNNSNTPSCAACADGSNHTASSPNCPTFIAKQKALLQRFPENTMPYYPTEERWTWVQNPANPERPSSPAPLDQPRLSHYDRQNLTRYQQYQNKLNRQTNRRSTDTYIPDDGWPQTRRQFTLQEAWGSQSIQAQAPSSQPTHSQQNADVHSTGITQ